MWGERPKKGSDKCGKDPKTNVRGEKSSTGSQVQRKSYEVELAGGNNREKDSGQGEKGPEYARVRPTGQNKVNTGD